MSGKTLQKALDQKIEARSVADAVLAAGHAAAILLLMPAK
jgi:hypothetical protein